MKRIIEYFIKYSITGDVLLILIIIFGYMGMKSLKSTTFPEGEVKTVQIQVVYPGASPEEIEQSVVLKIEDKLQGLMGMEKLTSISSENAASVTATVLKSYDTDEMVQDIKNAVDQIASFPSGVETINIFKVERVNNSISFALSGEVDLKTLKTYARKIERDMLASPNISQVEMSGFPEEEITINFSEERLKAYQLTFQEVVGKIAATNIERTGGTILGEKEELRIRVKNKEYSGYELNDVVVKSSSDGRLVYLRDVATIKDDWAETPNLNYFNGRPAVIMDIKNTTDEDIITISAEVQEYLEDFNEENSVVQATVTDDNAKFVRQRIELLSENGVIGFVLVLILLTLFLHYRLSFWVALSIPISFAGMFILASFYGLTLNFISLFGMIVVIGILVDDGVVIAENIYTHFEKGKKPIQAAIDGTLEVIPAVFSAILTTMIVFSTFFFLEGNLGDFFSQVSFVVIASLIFSLIEGVFILPAHIAHSKALTKKGDKKSKLTKATNKFMDRLRYKWYKPVIQFCLRNKALAIAIPLGIFLITIGALQGGIIRTTFFPQVESETLRISVQMPAGTSANETNRVLEEIEKAAWQVNTEIKDSLNDEAEYILSTDRRVGPTNAYEAKLNIELSPTEERELSALEISSRIEAMTPITPGAEIQFGGGANNFGKPVSLGVQGDNIDEVRTVVSILKEKIKNINGLKDVTDNAQEGLKEINVVLTPKAYLLGLTEQDVIGQIRQGFFGGEIQRLQRGLDEVKIWVRYAKDERSSMDDLRNIEIRTNTGSSYPLLEIAELEVARGVLAINHTNGIREIKVEADLSSTEADVIQIINLIETKFLPEISASHPNIQFEFGGQVEEQKKTIASMSKVMPVILLLMFTVVLLTFRSFSQTFILIPIIVLSMIGVAWGHWIHNIQISLLSMMGFIALIGVLINDTLVFMQAFNNNLRSGLSYNDSLLDASVSRFRPILLTSITTIAGLAPLILEQSRQAQYLIPMAVTLAYGLVFSTILILVVLPVLLKVTNDIKVYWKYWWYDERVERKTVEKAYKETLLD
jgi:multidrug efflux pump subunit AcrB